MPPPSQPLGGGSPSARSSLFFGGRPLIVTAATWIPFRHDRRRCAPDLLVCDLDGTLLRPDATLSDTTVRVVNDFIAGGGLFTYATARSFTTASRVTAPLKLTLPVITYGGAIVVDPRSRLVVRVDALVEAVLGAGFGVLAAVAPRRGIWRLPGYAPSAVVAVIAAALLALAGWLWWRSRRPDRSLLVLLAAGNGTTAVVVFWYAAVVPAGSAIVALLSATGVALLVLAAVQFALARRAAAPAVGEAAGASGGGVSVSRGAGPTR